MHGTLRTIWHYVSLMLKGMAYGVTHIVPGIGGGLILVVLGIYEPFVDAVGNFFLRRDRWREYVPFLVALGAGMVLAMLVFSHLISAAAERYPAATAFFFMGLLVGTIPGILRIHHDMRPSAGRVIALLLGVLTVMGFRLLQTRFGVEKDATGEVAGGSLYVAVTSFVAGGASVTPGLDGTYIWMLAGVYQRILGAIAGLASLVIDWGILIPTGLGAVSGILSFSKLIDAAFRRAPGLAHYVVLGLVTGSVYGLWPSEPARTGVVGLVLSFVAGTGVALAVGRSPEGAEAPASPETRVSTGAILAGDPVEEN